LHDSRLIAVGTPAELKATVPGMVLEVRAGPLDVALHALAPWQPALHVAVADTSARERVEEALRAAGIDEVDIRPIAPSLEDAYLALMAGGKVGRAA
jgi:hypothetical protein